MIAIRLIVVLCVLVLSLSLKDIPERARGGSAAKSNNYLLQASGDAKIYKSTIDNFDNSTATFDQRYFVDNQFYKAGGPVFFEIGGEGTLGGAPAGFMATLAEEYGAALVALEHRFYGESIPNGNSNTDNLKYLTVEQALADLNSFTQWYKRVEKLDDSKW